MNRIRPRFEQRGGRHAQRRTRREHIVHQHDVAPRCGWSGGEVRTDQSVDATGAGLGGSTSPPPTADQADALATRLRSSRRTRRIRQRSSDRSRNYLGLIKPPSSTMRRSRRSPRDGVDVIRRRVNERPVSQRNRFAQPARNGTLAPVLQRMNELPTHTLVRKQQRNRGRTLHHSRLRRHQRRDAGLTRTPPQPTAPRTTHLEQHCGDRRSRALRRGKDFPLGISIGSGPPCMGRRHRCPGIPPGHR